MLFEVITPLPIMDAHKTEQLGPLAALFGLLTQPGETAEALFEDHRPPHIIIILLMGLIVVFGPMFFVSLRVGIGKYDHSTIYGLLLVAVFGFIAFVVLEGLFLCLFGVFPSIRELFACAAYSLAPVIAGLIVIHALNYYLTGDLALVQSLFGSNVSQSKFGRILPWAIGIILVDMVLVLLYSLRSIGEMHVFSAFCLAVLSLIPLYGAILLGLIGAEMALPGSRNVFFAMLAAYR